MTNSNCVWCESALWCHNRIETEMGQQWWADYSPLNRPRWHLCQIHSKVAIGHTCLKRQKLKVYEGFKLQHDFTTLNVPCAGFGSVSHHHYIDILFIIMPSALCNGLELWIVFLLALHIYVGMTILCCATIFLQHMTAKPQNRKRTLIFSWQLISIEVYVTL